MQLAVRILVGLAMVTLSGVQARAEVVKQDERGFVTRAVSEVATSPTETWLALIAPGKWWNSSHSWSGDATNMTLTPQAGGCFCEKIPGKDNGATSTLDGSARHMEVVMAMPPQVLRMRGGLGPLQSEPVDGVLTVTLRPADDGTRIVWEYVVGGFFRFEVPVIARAVDGVMSEQLNRLTEFVGPLKKPEPDAAPSAEPIGPVVEEAPLKPSEAEPKRATVDESFGDIGR